MGERATSLVRVKGVVLFLIFYACWLYLKYFDGPRYENTLLAVAGASALLFYFVRCEKCKSSIYYTAGGKRHLFLWGAPRFLMANECPICGLIRV
jgi:hypothetical protein